ncbi:TPA: hypothetical protein EYP38_01630 [Candidatus Micrarchaeota archaeon]|nr:hypothetical protein [Candidatus Micrarchaeota archaeon]
MIENLFPFAVALVAGFLVKIVDWIDDDKKGKNPIKWPLAVIYGLLIGYLIGTASFSVLFLAAVVAQVFAKKIDTRAHMLGIAATAISMLYFGLQPIPLNFFAYFLILAFLDEADFIGRLRPLEKYRLVLKVGAAMMILVGRWDFFIAILSFDFGYELFDYLQKRIIK